MSKSFLVKLFGKTFSNFPTLILFTSPVIFISFHSKNLAAIFYLNFQPDGLKSI